MSRIHQILAVAVSILLLALIAEGGLRLLGFAPRPTMNRFDAALGWSKEPDARIRRRTSEFDVTLETNSRGLREPESRGYAKPAGEQRILIAGDSFTLGYTVESADTLSALLERSLRAEGRAVEVLNGGTEGYSTDQEVLWLAREGVKYDPEIVVLQMYENDVFWNSQSSYLRYPKPHFAPAGPPEQALAAGPALQDPGRDPWLQRNTAAGTLLGGLLAPPAVPMLPGPVPVPAEWGVRLRDDAQGWPETAAALRAFRWLAEERGFKPLVLVIPDKAQIDPAAKGQIAGVLRDPAYDPARPYRRMLELAREAGLAVVDPEAALRAASDGGRRPLYFEHDWHTNPIGNRVIVAQLDGALAAPAFLGPPPRAAAAPALGDDAAREPARRHTTAVVLTLVWLALGTGYWRRFPTEGAARSYASVGGLILAVVGIAAGFGWLVELLPPWIAHWVSVAVVVGLAGAILWYLRARLPVMAELFASFVRRGQWYMLPVLVGLLSLGGLLVVAASSPWLAPFIYTLF